MTVVRLPASGTKPVFAATARTRVTNGRDLLPGVDGRTYWARRMRDVMALLVSDLGGPAACSEAEKAIVRRAATLIVELERMEAAFAQAEGAGAGDLELYSRLSNSLRRLLDVTGLQRRSRDVTPTLDQYVEATA